MPAKAVLVLKGRASQVFAIIRRMSHQTTLTVQCAWCGKDMGQKDGQGQEGVTHGMCDECAAKQLEKATPHKETAP